MGFYDSLDCDRKLEYVKFLGIMGSLSRLFSENDAPYLDSRICENLFCRCLGAENLARQDCTADAKLNGVGIGIKTWVGSGMQKIAEFNRARPEYASLVGLEKIKKIAELRNERIEMTMRTHALKSMVYHVTTREEGTIRVQECPLEKIDIDRIRVVNESETSIAFEDGRHHYSFNLSKSVLMMRFDALEEKALLSVKILDDPYKVIENILLGKSSGDEKTAISIATEGLYPDVRKEKHPFIFLKLYSYRNKKTYEKYVPESSGLNVWNSRGRKRDPNEAYIPISREDHRRTPNFFPDRDTPFDLILPNGRTISAKVCQDGSKALMSNPNLELGKWLLRDVFGIKEGQLIDYKFFRKMGIDSVKIEKLTDCVYKINFAVLDSYENWMLDYRIENYED